MDPVENQTDRRLVRTVGKWEDKGLGAELPPSFNKARLLSFSNVLE